MTPDPEQLAELHARQFAGPQDRMLRQAGRALEAAVQHLPEAEQIAFAERYMERLAQMTLSLPAHPDDATRPGPPAMPGLLGHADPRNRRSGLGLWLPVLLVALALILVLLMNVVGSR